MASAGLPLQHICPQMRSKTPRPCKASRSQFGKREVGIPAPGFSLVRSPDNEDLPGSKAEGHEELTRGSFTPAATPVSSQHDTAASVAGMRQNAHFGQNQRLALRPRAHGGVSTSGNAARRVPRGASAGKRRGRPRYGAIVRDMTQHDMT